MRATSRQDLETTGASSEERVRRARQRRLRVAASAVSFLAVSQGVRPLASIRYRIEAAAVSRAWCRRSG